MQKYSERTEKTSLAADDITMFSKADGSASGFIRRDNLKTELAPTSAEIVTSINNELGSTAWQQDTDTNLTDSEVVAAVNNALGNTDWQGNTPSTPGVTLSKTSATTQEGGATNSYSVVLDSAPIADVTISIAADNTENNVDQTSLVFTTATYNVPQDVTITADDDAVVDGDQVTVFTHTATSADGDYNGITIPNVTATALDNDAISGNDIIFSGATSAVTSGYLPTLNMQLTLSGSNPTAFVAVYSRDIDDHGTVSIDGNQMTQIGYEGTKNISGVAVYSYAGLSAGTYTVSLNATEYRLFAMTGVSAENVASIGTALTEQSNFTSSSTLTQTSSEMLSFINTQEDRTITHNQLQLASGDHPNVNMGSFSMANGADDSSTFSFSSTGMSHIAIPLTSTNDSVPGVSLSQSTFSIVEGETGVYSVVLTQAPAFDVTISITPDNAEASTNVSTLTFTSTDWNVPQDVTITATDDLVADGDLSTAISHAATSSDAVYNGIAIPSVIVTAIDDDSTPSAYGSIVGSILTINTTNRSQRYNVEQMETFYNRFGAHDHLKGETGTEVGSPNEWKDALRSVIGATIHMGGQVACWATGAAGFASTYNMRPYTYDENSNTITNVESSGEIFEEAIALYGDDKFYMNVDGLVFQTATAADEGIWAALYARGWRNVRIPFSWVRMQPSLNGALDATHLNLLVTEVTRARAAGMQKIIIDCHSYGSHSDRENDPRSTQIERRIGGNIVNSGHLADMWTKLMAETAFNGATDIEIDVMNEPETMKYIDDSGTTEYAQNVREAIVEDMMETVKDALDATGNTYKIWQEGWNFAGVQDTGAHRLNGHFNSIHDYIDIDNSGTHTRTYAQEDALLNDNSPGTFGYVPNPIGTFTFDNSDNAKHNPSTLNNV